MHFAAVAALFAALAAAAPVDASPTPYFKVFNFTAACIQHSTQCIYDFDLFIPGSVGGEQVPGVHCQKMLTSDGNVAGVLPAVTDGTCMESGRTWTVAKNPDGSLNLTASTQVSPVSTGVGSHIITISDLVLEQDFASQAERYIGDRDFGLYTPQN